MGTLNPPELQLEVGRAPAPLPDGEPSEVWRDEAGGVIASGWLRGDLRSLAFPGLGVYEFSAGGRGPVVASAEPGAWVPHVVDTFRRSVLPLALQVRGAEVLHASGVVIRQRVVALCAVSGTGKSTLARALGGRGHRLWADDAVAFDGAHALPLPFQLKLRPRSSEWFGEPALSPLYGGLERHPLGAICVLTRIGAQGDRVDCLRLTPSAAFPHLIRHAYCFSLADLNRKRDMMERYLRLAAEVPVFELRFPEGLERLDEMCEAIEQAACL